MKFGNTETGVLHHMFENADALKGAALGVTLRLLIFKPKSLLAAACSAATGVVLAVAFGADLSSFSGLSPSAGGAVAALTGDALARRVLDWVRRGRLPIIGDKPE